MANEENRLEYDNLTEKQKRFIDYYIETANATEAAIRAGYSKKTAKQIGCENLAKLDYFIKSKLDEKAKDRIASQDEVLEFLTRVIRGEEKDQFDLDASLKDRIESAKLLGQRYGTFTQKVDVKVEENTKFDEICSQVGGVGLDE